MAKITNNVLGTVSGSIGNLSFSSWKTLRIVRAKRGPSTTPPTDAQKLIQEKFKELSRIGKAFFSIVKIGMGQAAKGSTEQNMFLSRNFSSISGVLGSITVDFSKLKLAMGTLEHLNGPSAASASGSISINWSFLNYGNANDSVIMAAYNPEINQIVQKQDLKRSDQTGSIAAPAFWVGKIVHVYVFSKNADSKVSDSQYAGQVTVA